MTADWRDPPEVREMFRRAYGRKAQDQVEKATRKPFVLQLDETELKKQQALREQLAAEWAAKLSA